MSKKYGLILHEKPKSKQPIFQASKNVFGDESDSEEESKTKPLLRPSHNTNRQAKLTQDKAVVEDPTVYQYDEIYDSMTSKKEEEKNKSKEIKKPKYIENLLKTATKRKIENERRVERQVQKERETEGEEFADKEVFVTTAYKRKLEELRQEEEKEKREEYLESIGDVTKQSDLGGFYRHLYELKLGTDKNKVVGSKSESIDESEGVSKEEHTTTKPKQDKIRNYRKRKSSEINADLSEGEIEESDDEINRIDLKDIRAAKKAKQDDGVNIDADSDFSVDDPSSDDDDNDSKSSAKENVKESATSNDIQDTKPKKDEDVKELSKNETTAEKEPKLRIDIWKKRTVGEIFEQALKRYYERKSCRGY